MAFGNQARIDIMAQDKTGRAIASARKNLTGLGKTARSVITGIGGIGAGLAVGALVRDVARVNLEFEKASREVNTLLGLSSDGFRDLQKDIRGVSSALGTDLVDNTKAAYQAISAGVKRQDLTKFLKVANKAAIGGVSDVETAVNVLTGVLNAYRGSNLDAAQAADSLFTAVKDGKTTFGEMADAMYIAAPIASTAGISFDELAASIATISATTGNTSVAMTQIKGAIVALMKPSAEMAEIFRHLGVSSGEALIDARGFGGAMADIRKAAEQHNISLIEAFRRIEGYNAMVNTTGGNLQTFNDNLANQTNKAGANQAAFDEMNKSMSRGFDKVRASWQALATSMGNTDFTTNATDALAKGMNEWTAIFSGGEHSLRFYLDKFEHLAAEPASIMEKMFKGGERADLLKLTGLWRELGESPKSYEEAIVLLRAKLMVLNPILDDTGKALAEADENASATADSFADGAGAAGNFSSKIQTLKDALDDMLDMGSSAPSTDSVIGKMEDWEKSIESAQSRFADLQRDNQILLNPKAETGILKKEVADLEAEISGLAQGSLKWEEKRVELQEKKNELLRHQIGLQEDVARALRDGTKVPADEADKKKRRSSSHLMADYSNPDYTSPWRRTSAPAPLTPPLSVLPPSVAVTVPPVSTAPASSPAPMETATQSAVAAIESGTQKAAEIFEKVSSAVTEFVNRLSIAEQQIANAR